MPVSRNGATPRKVVYPDVPHVEPYDEAHPPAGLELPTQASRSSAAPALGQRISTPSAPATNEARKMAILAAA